MTTLSVVDVERKNWKTIVVDFSSTGQLMGKAHRCLQLGHFCNSNTSNSRKRSQQIVVAESDNISYIGKNFGENEIGLQKQCKYYVGIVDETTGKMRICDTDIFQMKPFLKDKPPELVFDEDKSNLSFREKVDMLTKAFGSARQKKAVQSRLLTQVKRDLFEKSLTAAADQALEAGGKKLLEGLDNKANNDDSMPPCNRDADIVDNVYNLNDIIPPVEMEALTDPAKEFFNCTKEDLKQWEQSNSCPHFVLKQLSILPHNEEARWQKSKCLLFMKYLCTLYNLNGKQMKMINQHFPEDCPDVVKEMLLNRFTLLVEGTNNKKPTRCIPAWMKDKIAYYILVLGLIIDHFSTEFTHFQKELKIGLKKLNLLFQMLGCKISKKKNPDGGRSNEVYTATLTIPLQPMLNYRVKTKKAKKNMR